MLYIATFLFTHLLVTVVIGDSPPIVDIPGLGQIQGQLATSLNNKPFFSFEGVPYAEAPVGGNRFRAPQTVKPWNGTWPAKTIYKCLQYHQYTPPGEDFVVGEEDCLYLNIYTPSLDLKANLDVVIYIHGGAFMFNHGGVCQPDFLLDQKLVYVSLNYRLGPLGFLTTEDDVIPGNNGLKDQIMALEWIQKYIKSFGGNSMSVTLLGMSAGGASVHFHYLCPQSKNLFHRGISQSGTMLNHWVLMEKGLEKTQILASHLGCSIQTNQVMVDCLKSRSGRSIVNAVKIFQKWLYNPFSPFGAVVDSWSSNPVLPEHPLILIRKGKVANYPWIVSWTNSEGLYPGSDFYQEHIPYIDQNWNELLPAILDYNHTLKVELHNEISQRIRKKYLGNQAITKSNFMDLIRIFSDRMFVVDIRKSVKLQKKTTTSPIYVYCFTYRGKHSKSESRSHTEIDFGAAHGDDTGFIFKTNVDVVTSPSDKAMIKVMVKIVSSFARNGKPSIGVTWTPILDNNTKTMRLLAINSPQNLSMVDSVEDNADFWASLPFEENENVFKDIKDEL